MTTFINQHGQTVPVQDKDGFRLPVSGGGESGGGGGGLTDEQLRASPVPVEGPLTDEQLRAAAVPVSGPLTNAQLVAALGAANNPAWDGAAASATGIAILKAIYAQQEVMIGLLNDIKTNTTVTP